MKVTSFKKWGLGRVFNIDQSIGTTFITLLLNLIHQRNVNVLYLDAAELSLYIYIYMR